MGRRSQEQLELISLYAGHAASVIERERLLDAVTRRNRVLEGLRGILESLAGPDRVRVGLVASPETLRTTLRADAVAIRDAEELVRDAARSLQFALEGEELAIARREAEAYEPLSTAVCGTSRCPFE